MLLTFGGLAAAVVVITLAASEAAHRTKQANPYENPGEDWSVDRTAHYGLLPLTLAWLVISVITYVFAR